MGELRFQLRSDWFPGLPSSFIAGRRSGRGEGKKRRGEKVESRFLPLWDWFVCLSLDCKCTPQDLGSWSLYFHSLIHTVDTYWACMGDRHWATEVKKLQLVALNNSRSRAGGSQNCKMAVQPGHCHDRSKNGALKGHGPSTLGLHK